MPAAANPRSRQNVDDAALILIVTSVRSPKIAYRSAQPRGDQLAISLRYDVLTHFTVESSAISNPPQTRRGRRSPVSFLHGDPHSTFGGDLLGSLVARVDVPDHSHAGIVGQHAGELLSGQFRAVG
jgi:hypothetical protein